MDNRIPSEYSNSPVLSAHYRLLFDSEKQSHTRPLDKGKNIHSLVRSISVSSLRDRSMRTYQSHVVACINKAGAANKRKKKSMHEISKTI